MPIRPIDDQHIKIYRQFDFGTLVQLTMLDTRIIARNVQLDYANYMTATGLDIAKFQADLINPARTLMGVEQRNWLLQKLQQSTATWNVNMECTRPADSDEQNVCSSRIVNVAGRNYSRQS